MTSVRVPEERMSKTNVSRTLDLPHATMCWWKHG